jgi:hypothetical protein
VDADVSDEEALEDEFAGFGGSGEDDEEGDEE